MKEISVKISNFMETKKIYILIISLIIFFSLVILYNIIFIFHTDIIRIRKNTNPVIVALPDKYIGNNGEIVTYLFQIKKNILNQGWFKILADDNFYSLKINGENIDLKTLKYKGSLNNWQKGFITNLQPYLTKNLNDIEIEIENYGQAISFNIFASKYNVLKLIFFMIVQFLLFFILFFILRYFLKINNKIILIISCALIIRFLYFSVTPYNVRSHDQEDHLQYINYILDNHRLPKASEGWSFFHPPLYYLISAFSYIFIKIIGLSNKIDKYLLFQYNSLIFSFIYTIFSVKIVLYLKETILDKIKIKTKTIQNKSVLSKIFNYIQSNNFLIYIVIILLCFWPSSILDSVRIGNDPLLYMFFAISLYFLIRWYFEDRNMNLIISLIFAALSLITKNNALLMFITIGTAVLYKNISAKKYKLLLIHIGLIFAFFMIGIIFNYRTEIIETFFTRENHLFGNQMARHPSNRLNVGNYAYNYLWFDLKTFITQPYAGPWEDTQGRQFFLNFLLKSSLFGEYDFNYVVMKNLAYIMSFLLIVMLMLFLISIIFTGKEQFKNYFVLYANLFFLIIGLAMFRINLPVAPANDFRYIHPALIAFCYLFIINLSLFKNDNKQLKKLYYTGLFTTILFIILSICFILYLFLVSNPVFS